MGLYTACSGEVSLTGGAAKTILLLHAGASVGDLGPTVPGTGLETPPVNILEIGVSFKSGTSTDTPVKVEVFSASTDGTMTTITAANIQNWAAPTGSGPVTVCKRTATVEPTLSTEPYLAWEVSPLGVAFAYTLLPYAPLQLTNGARLAVRCNAAQNQTVESYILFNE